MKVEGTYIATWCVEPWTVEFWAAGKGRLRIFRDHSALDVALPEVPQLLEAIHEATASGRLLDTTEEWRHVCADMIRLGKDSEAVALLVEKAPDVVPYIKTLEALYHAFASLPALDAYERMVHRDAGHFDGKIQIREKIAAYAAACAAWQKIKDTTLGAPIAPPHTPNAETIDRVVFHLLNSLDSLEAWSIARRDPDALRAAVRHALKGL